MSFQNGWWSGEDHVKFAEKMLRRIRASDCYALTIHTISRSVLSLSC